MCIGKTQNSLFGAVRDNEPTLMKSVKMTYSKDAKIKRLGEINGNDDTVNINLIIDWSFEQNPEILNG